MISICVRLPCASFEVLFISLSYRLLSFGMMYRCVYVVYCCCCCQYIVHNASEPSFEIHLRENIDEILPHCVVFHYEFVSFQFTKPVEQRCFQYPKFHCNRNQPCEKGCVNGATLRLLLHNKAENQLKETTLTARKYHGIFHKAPIHFIYKQTLICVPFENYLLGLFKFKHGDHV